MAGHGELEARFGALVHEGEIGDGRKGRLQGLDGEIESAMRHLDFDVGEASLGLEDRFGTIASKENFDDRVDETQIEADDKPGIPLRDLVDRDDRAGFVGIENLADPTDGDVAHRHVHWRGGEVAKSLRANAGQTVDDHLQHRQAVERDAA